jgi:cation:H+ antiporter
MVIIYLTIFFVSFFVLAFSSKWLVGSLTKMAKFLGWKEFVVAFFTMALAGAIPNFSVGISSALHQIPQLSFSEIIGGNIVDLSLAVALAALISRRGLALPSRTVQGSALFTIAVAILPLLLVFDGTLSRIDGLLLILAFVIYISWLFNKKERFSKVYDQVVELKKFRAVFKNLAILLGAIFLLLLAAEGIVRPAIYFSTILNLPLVLIGILVVSLGNALPEIFFSIQAARKGEDWLVVGNLMGSVIIPVTLVLGIVVLICPIQITNFSPFAIGRFFLIISAIFFLLFLRTGKKITRREGLFLLLIYLTFVLAEILSS